MFLILLSCILQIEERRTDRKEAAKKHKMKHTAPILYGPSWNLPSKEEREKDPILDELMSGFLFDYSKIQEQVGQTVES